MASKIEPLLTVADLDAFPGEAETLRSVRSRGILDCRLATQSILLLRLRGQDLEEVATLTGDNELSSPILPGFSLKASAVFNL